MTKNETLAYLAGVFDGEGCVGVYSRKQRVKKYYQLSVHISMVEDAALVLFHDMFGGWFSKRRSRGLPRTQNYRIWQVQTKQALVFLESVFPYLLVKKDQALLAIEFQKTKRLNHGSKGLSNEERAYEEEIYHRLRELKGRGYTRPDTTAPNAVLEVK